MKEEFRLSLSICEEIIAGKVYITIPEKLFLFYYLFYYKLFDCSKYFIIITLSFRQHGKNCLNPQTFS